MASSNKPAVERCETFFRHCNETRYLRSRQAIANALGVLEISDAGIDNIFTSATSIWSRNSGTLSNFLARSPATMTRFDAAAAQLRAARPGFFQMNCSGPEEQKFVRQRAAEAIISLTNEFNRPSRHVRKQKAPNGDRKDEEMDVDDTKLPPVDATQVETYRRTVTITFKKPAIEMKPAPTIISVVPPFFVEVQTAKKGLRLMKIESRHVLTSGGSVPSFEILQTIVKAFPLIDWPEKFLLIHVVDHKNTFIYEQITLETAFAGWRRREPTSENFLVYVNDYEDFPPAKILGEDSNDS